jgi:hypothetical protein
MCSLWTRTFTLLPLTPFILFSFLCFLQPKFHFILPSFVKFHFVQLFETQNITIAFIFSTTPPPFVLLNFLKSKFIHLFLILQHLCSCSTMQNPISTSSFIFFKTSTPFVLLNFLKPKFHLLCHLL